MVEYRIGFEVISYLSLEKLSTLFYERFDGVLAERGGKITVFVYVSGGTGIDAAWAAIKQLEEIEACVVRTDADLVDGPEIASRLGVTRQAVQHWGVGSRGNSFPHPVGDPGGKRIWAWAQIVDWYRRDHPDFDEAPGLTQDDAAIIDAMLANRRRGVSGTRIDWAVGPGSLKSQAALTGTDDYYRDRKPKLSVG
jgi:hypothetical protein